MELHGTNLLVECQTCHRRSDPEPHFESFRQTHLPPRCECGGFLKPATISFGQSLVPEDLDRAGEAATGADLVVALGSSLSVCRFHNDGSRFCLLRPRTSWIHYLFTK